MTAERDRLVASQNRTEHWKKWGPYLSERAWGTVREDYSADGSAWDYFPHDHARSRAYRWNEDGLAGISDNHQRFCFAVALWNGNDPILKERLFGVTGSEGNHGEDVKEYYYYIDSTPTHSYMKSLYKYPQAAFPYGDLVATNRSRGKDSPEYELIDTGAFNESRYFDVFVEYAKAGIDDILVRYTVANRGPVEATVDLMPTFWLRNTWTWTDESPAGCLAVAAEGDGGAVVAIDYHQLPKHWVLFQAGGELLFTDNETNSERLYGSANATPFVKDAFDSYVVHGKHDAVNPARTGTKVAARYHLAIPAGESRVVCARLVASDTQPDAAELLGDGFSSVFDQRSREADDFYDTVIPSHISRDAKLVMRQALAGMLWSKQYYEYIVRDWLNGDSAEPTPPPLRKFGRNSDWQHVYSGDVISMPDKWEYPWFAAWDLSFHCVALSIVDPDFAKDQLVLLLREWYMHPNGQIPAYEWAFGDVNPPVHAWAAMRVYQIDRKLTGNGDRMFLERIFQKLMLNFTWWVNRKDNQGRNIFQGGFLGLDNIGVFDRSAPLPTGGYLEQADGTAWMGMYCLNMLAIALELAHQDPAYEDIASKFWEHFIYIANSLNNMGDEGQSLWDEDDGFYYDRLNRPDAPDFALKVRSLVGAIPIFGVETMEPDVLNALPSFKKRLEWFLGNRPDLCGNVASMHVPGQEDRRLFALVTPDRLKRVLKFIFDDDEFLSAYGLRALSKFHDKHPYSITVNGQVYSVDYEPGESNTSLFGGNSNWRGPIWFPLNYLLIESLQKYHYYLGDDFKVEFPTGSGIMLNLWEASSELSRRLMNLFLRDHHGRRAVFGDEATFQNDEHWRDLVPFHEYFHGDTGRGVGASHQTGWTGLIAKLIQQSGV